MDSDSVSDSHLSPVVERAAVEAVELRYGVGCTAVKSDECLDSLHFLPCAAHPHGSPGSLLIQGFHSSPN